MKTLFRNAEAVIGREVVRTNVLVEGSTIVAVDAPASATADEVVDCTGLHLLPGVVDDQVHFRDPGITHKEDLFTASCACAAGGVTSFLEMPNTIPNTVSQAALEAKLALASRKSVVNYGFFVGATETNTAELKHAHRTPGIKIFIGSSTGNLLVDEQEALERIFAETSLTICVHAEDETLLQANKARIGETSDLHDHSRIRNHEVAMIATRRAMDLAFRHKHPLHVLHVSTGDETDVLAEHRNLVTAEACVHHIFLSVDDYDRLGTLAQMNPSLKNRDDNRRIWQALKDRRLQVIATDHAPHLLSEKARPYPQSPSGVPGVQTMLPMLLNQVAAGECSLVDVVEWMCEAPARVWDMVGKGRIAVGADADLVLVDMKKVHEVRNEEQLTKCGWSVWAGRSLTGWPIATWVMGRQVYRDGRVLTDHRGAEIQYDHGRGGYWATASDFAS